MNISTALYIILICPLELMFEVIFYLANSILSNPGLSIMVLSLVVNFLVLPLYSRADAIQTEEREKEKKMEHWVRHIRKTFKGDERFMMLQTYYRQNDYKPTYVFRSLLPLALQVPFFIAAYRFLSQIKILHGAAFGPISDLGAPDGMITLFGFTINFLPILMTLINIASGMIYTQNAPIKEKLQLFGVALVFLFLLYRSPAGLVFYWTLNNVFSLVRNLVSGMKDPRAFVLRLSSALGFIIIGFAFGRDVYSTKQKVFLIIISFILITVEPVVRYLKRYALRVIEESGKSKTYLLSAIYISLLVGILIPSAVIESSTAEFVSVTDMRNPVNYVISCACLAIGTFIIWLGVFYCLSRKESRTVFAYITWICAIVFTVDYMFFGTGFGILSPQLQYELTPVYTMKMHLVNSLVVLLSFVICFILLLKTPKLVSSVLISGILICSGMSAINILHIVQDYSEITHAADYINSNPVIKLSRNKQNVVVIMMDKMVSYYIPYLMNEDPDLYKSYDGFTYYPNTVSYGSSTNCGTPGLFGGYEYVPEKMNERDTELLVDKHNEALKVMPVMYSRQGYDVTVCDASLANYKWIPDMSIYDDYPEISKYLVKGTLSSRTDHIDPMTENLNRNFFCYALYKAVPTVFQLTVYNRGNYNAMEKYDLEPDEWNSKQILYGLSKSSGMDANFMSAYNVISRLDEMTQLTDDGRGGFFMIANTATHDPQLLKLPEYEPAEYVDNTSYDNEQFIKRDAEGNTINIEDELNVTTYQNHMAVMRKLGEWFDYLKKQGIYDNTKIIVVSDHAYGVGLNENFIVDNVKDGKKGTFDCIWFNCVLLVKDFNAKGFNVDNTFMTNADVPTIATKDTIDDPHNPFTGKKIENSDKENESMVLMGEEVWDVEENNGYRFLPAMQYTVHDNIFEHDNWSFLGYY